GARRLEQGPIDAAHAVDRVQQDGEEAEEGDEGHLLRVPDRMQEDDRDRQQCRRRHRAPDLDVRHRRPACPGKESERNAEGDAEHDCDREAEPDALEARDDVLVEVCEEPQLSKLDGDRRRPRELHRVCARGPELPAHHDRDRDGDLGGGPPETVGASAHNAARRWEGCQRSALRSTALKARWMTSPSAPVATARAYIWSFSPYDSAKFSACPSPGVPMKSSAVKARISATVEEMRNPVAMYGTALGNVT